MHQQSNAHEYLYQSLDSLKGREAISQHPICEGIVFELRRLESLLPQDTVVQVLQDVNRRLYEMIQSNDLTEKFGALLLIEKLIEYSSFDNEAALIRYGNYIRSLLPSDNDELSMTAVETLVKILTHIQLGDYCREVVRQELEKVAEWSSNLDETKIFNSIVLIKSFTQSLPYHLLQNIEQIIPFLLRALQSRKAEPYRSALDSTLRNVLLCIRSRLEHSQANSIISEYLDPILAQSDGSSSTQTLSMLAFLSATCTIFHILCRDMYYGEIVRLALQYTRSKDSAVRSEACNLLCQLLKVSPSKFSEYIDSWVNLLIKFFSSKKDVDINIALRCLRFTVETNEHLLRPHLDSFSDVIRKLMLYSKGTFDETEILNCISSLAKVLKSEFTSSFHALLPAMFDCSFNLVLRNTLLVCISHVPHAILLMEDQLLKLLEKQLMDICNEKEQIFACESADLFTFSFPVLDTNFGAILRNKLTHSTIEIRKSVSMTLLKLCSKNTINESILETPPSVRRTLHQLLCVASCDDSHDLRIMLIKALNSPDLDSFFSSPEIIPIILSACNNEVVEVRLNAMKILSRVANSNLGVVFPFFRPLLLQLLAGLECTNPLELAENSAIVLSELVNFPPVLVKPIVEPLLRSLMKTLENATPTTATYILISLTTMVQVSPEAFTDHSRSLIDEISKVLGDTSSSSRRLASLKFLCTLLRSVDRAQIPFLRLSVLLRDIGELLKVELVRPVRDEAIKLLGIVGALDPYTIRIQEMKMQVDMVRSEKTIDFKDFNHNSTEKTVDVCEQTVVDNLLKLITDELQPKLFGEALSALLTVIQNLGSKGSVFLPRVISMVFELLSRENDSSKTSLFAFLVQLVRTSNIHIRPFAPQLINYLKRQWVNGVNVSYHDHMSLGSEVNNNSDDITISCLLLNLAEALATALMGEITGDLAFLTPIIVPHITPKLLAAGQNGEKLLSNAISAATMVSLNTPQYFQLIITSVTTICNEMLQYPYKQEHSTILAKSISLVKLISQYSDSRLSIPSCLELLNIVARNEGFFDVIDFMKEAVYSIYRIYPEETTRLLSKELLNSTAKFDGPVWGGGTERTVTAEMLSSFSLLTMDDILPCVKKSNLPLMQPPNPLNIGEINLRRSWECSDCKERDDWFVWWRRLELEFLRETPSPAIKACAVLASKHFLLAKKIFNVAFLVCWRALSETLQDELISAFENCLSSSSSPPEINQNILNLAEFMEREDSPLPIEASSLAAYSMKCHAFAKALYYQEQDYQAMPCMSSVEALISINSQLQLPDSAIGILVYAENQHGITLDESWFEKLQRWQEALTAYRNRWESDPSSFEALLGIFRCWHALGDWDSLSNLASDIWHEVPAVIQSSLVPLAASAAWSLGDWERMSFFTALQPVGSAEGCVFRSVLAINEGSYGEAKKYISATRAILDTELSAMINESYSRAYNTIVRAQVLSELEEVISYCRSQPDRNPSQREIIKSNWARRLDDCQVSVEVWQRLLKVRSLVLPVEEALSRWIKFAALCRRNDRPLLSRRILLGLLHVEENTMDSLDLTKASPYVVYGFLKHHWELGDRNIALRYLKQYTKFLAQKIDRVVATESSPQPEINDQTKLLAKCHLRLGEWQKILAAEQCEPISNHIIESFLAATSYDKQSYKAWHGWALVNFEMAIQCDRNQLEMQKENFGSESRSMPNKANPYLVHAIQGFFRSIGLSGGSNLQDSLRLLTLWFKYGAIAEVNAAVGDGFHSVPIDIWLQVIPQLIARIHVPGHQLRRMIQHLLADIGRSHPQALIYPLTVASKSQSVSRKTSALAILDKMKSHSFRLVEQAVTVSQDLIRVAILWEEMWYEGLEEASRLYFGESNVSAMLSILEPLHIMIEGKADTDAEKTFLDLYGFDLREARERCSKYSKSGSISELNAAWELYYQVFRRISKSLSHLNVIDLKTAAPNLLNQNQFELAVPGTYKAHSSLVCIASFSSQIKVISSKQRPRKLGILGSDGCRYSFLLKGHEDLRQDERVMQLFDLVNTLLEADAETRKRHLVIERFSVIPLSQNTGLIGWVPNCDTLHSLIRDYREAKGVLLSIEHRLMLQFAPDYDHIPLINKIEAFSWALTNTDGRDLGRVMWLSSSSSECWLDRRLSYIRSTAVMSMVGYILGLGDRHPSNLMIDQVSGRVVHIDFGDCFEVAMQRERFPELVPFRLTRMLIRAMEVSGVDGTYRITCENTMRVLRFNKDSLMAVLEAFVYDPLINWRLLARKEPVNNHSSSLSGLLSQKTENEDFCISPSNSQFPENFSSSRRARRDSEIARLEEESINRPESISAGVVNVINRVSNKLTGKDFGRDAVDVVSQVDCLISEATAVENLARAYVGWCAFW